MSLLPPRYRDLGLGANLRPKGRSHNKKRRLKCQDCKKHITQKGKFWFISQDQIDLIDLLLTERLALRAICRVLKISLSWLIAYIKRLYKKQPEDLNYRLPEKAEVQLQLIDSELDEMWSFVKCKSNKKWIWIAQCRTTRQVIAFRIGGRSRIDAQKLWDKIPPLVQQKGFFYSDDWDACIGVFPTQRHFYSKKNGIPTI
ncbi:MAG: insertion element IS1 protein InsB [Ulvibacter sp.]|jgi:insertion element IS1 protein InsB